MGTSWFNPGVRNVDNQTKSITNKINRQGNRTAKHKYYPVNDMFIHMKEDSVILPQDSEVSVRVQRGSQTECSVALLINQKVLGSLTMAGGLTGEFEIFGFRTPKSENTVLNVNKKVFNFNFSLFREMLGIG